MSPEIYVSDLYVAHSRNARMLDPVTFYGEGADGVPVPIEEAELVGFRGPGAANDALRDVIEMYGGAACVVRLCMYISDGQIISWEMYVPGTGYGLL